MIFLLQDQATNTDGTQDTFYLSPKNGRILSSENEKLVWAEGTFDGATVSFEVKPDGASSFGSEIDFTEQGRQIVTIPARMEVRGTVASAGDNTEITLGVS